MMNAEVRVDQAPDEDVGILQVRREVGCHVGRYHPHEVRRPAHPDAHEVAHGAAAVGAQQVGHRNRYRSFGVLLDAHELVMEPDIRLREAARRGP
jgi:hypothetical protein